MSKQYPGLKFVVMIPARTDSTRFPRKLYALINGIPVVEHTYNRAVVSRAQRVMIVAKDEEMADFCRARSMETYPTNGLEQNGTDGCAQRAASMPPDTKIVIVQGDEWGARPRDIDRLAQLLSPACVTTFVYAANEDLTENQPSRVKVVMNAGMCARSFCREDPPPAANGEPMPRYIHAGMYGLTAGMLSRYPSLDPHPEEASTGLEQLRWMHNGIEVRCYSTLAPEHDPINTKEDIP